jgi:hypothetical protein
MVAENSDGQSSLLKFNNYPLERVKTPLFRSGLGTDYWVNEGEDCECVDGTGCITARSTTGEAQIRHYCLSVTTVVDFACNGEPTSAEWCGPVHEISADGKNIAWVTTRTPEGNAGHPQNYELWAAQATSIGGPLQLFPNLVARSTTALDSPKIFVDNMLYLDHQTGLPRLRMAVPGQ